MGSKFLAGVSGGRRSARDSPTESPHDEGQPNLPSGGQAELPSGGHSDYVV